MKKIISLVLALSLVFAFATTTAMAADNNLKIGIILVHDENTGYDYAHIKGIKTAAEAAGISEDQIIWKYGHL